jgi:hypothetical protein
MDVKCFQLMRCFFCYASPVLISNVKTQIRKGLILYNNANVSHLFLHRVGEKGQSSLVFF